MQVEDEEVGLDLGEALKGRGRCRCYVDVPARREHLDEQERRGAVVLDDEDPPAIPRLGFRSSPRPSPRHAVERPGVHLGAAQRHAPERQPCATHGRQIGSALRVFRIVTRAAVGSSARSIDEGRSRVARSADEELHHNHELRQEHRWAARGHE